MVGPDRDRRSGGDGGTLFRLEGEPQQMSRGAFAGR